MSLAYNQLLDATIQHLEDLKSRGVRHVAIAPETLRALAQPSPRPAVPSQELRSSRREEAQTFPMSATGNQPAIQQSLLTSAVTDNLPASAAPLDPQAKAAAFAALRERALACVKCAHLASSRKNVAFGVGSIDAQLMFVGEAPGADEDEQGEPFVGKAGPTRPVSLPATANRPPTKWPRAFRICTSRLI